MVVREEGCHESEDDSSDVAGLIDKFEAKSQPDSAIEFEMNSEKFINSGRIGSSAASCQVDEHSSVTAVSKWLGVLPKHLLLLGLLSVLVAIYVAVP